MLKLALTCGEETAGAFNGAQAIWRHTSASLIDAAFALNEGAGERLDADGKPVALRRRGRREGPAGLPARSDQPRRPLVATDAQDNAIYHRWPVA
jgi:hypothetical protein